jgi:membrane protein DedA with SNARE-associated domain
MSGEALLGWLGEMPISALYLSIALVSAVENVFPPFPADITVAFGSFLAARGRGSPYLSFLLAWLGNMAGAGLVYFLARRYGSSAFMTRIEKWGGQGAETRLKTLYAKYGIPALFVSRFVPGVRALVPPFAGAMNLPVIPVALAVGAASAIWFALITWVAFFGAELGWESLRDRVIQTGSIVGLSALAIAVAASGWFLLRRRRGRPSTDA